MKKWDRLYLIRRNGYKCEYLGGPRKKEILAFVTKEEAQKVVDRIAANGRADITIQSLSPEDLETLCEMSRRKAKINPRMPLIQGAIFCSL